MCVIVASKIKLKNSEKENWFLYKIRDRAYVPEYKIKYNTGDKGVQAAYIVDNDSDWSEGVNEKGIMIVNAALQNHEDKKDGTNKGKKVSKGKVSRNGVIIREALKQDKIEDTVKILVDARFDGNTLVSDGKRLFVIEIFLHQTTKDKILADLEIDPISDEDDVKAILNKHITPEDYDVKVKEIKGDEKLVVRTNHGILLPKAGYQPKDGIGFDSSLNRRNVVIKTIEKLEPTHPFEILTALKNLGSADIHKEDIMRPIRTMPASPYLSTTVLFLTGTGSMYVLPLDCTFEETSFNRIQKDRNVHVVVLPKQLPLFEELEEIYEMGEKMPSNIVKSFAEKTGKSEAEVEKLWDEAKKQAEESEHKDDYDYIVGILKNMLKINENIDYSKIIVRDYGKPSPKNKDFKKDYIIIFKDKKHGSFYDAWNWDLGFEANISDEEIKNETLPVSKKEADEFIQYMKKEINEGKEMTYKEFYAKKLEKFGVEGPGELSDEDSKKFHDEIEKEWTGEKENEECADKKVEENYSVRALSELSKGNTAEFISITKEAIFKRIGEDKKYQELRQNISK